MLGRHINFEHEYTIIKDGQISSCEIKRDFSKCLLFYFDEKECLTCAYKHIPAWNSMIEENFGHEISPIYLFEELNDYSDLIVLTTLNENISIYVGEKSNFRKSNKFIPDESVYHTMLLGSDNEILAVGNPLGNTTLSDLYRKLITDVAYD